MSVIPASFSEFFTGADIILTNTPAQPDIAAALAVFGYDAAALQAGQSLLDTARARYDAQIRAYAEQHAATQTFYRVFNQADKTYAAHRQLAKVAFKNDPQRHTDLRLNERKPLAFNAWYQQARHFYTALRADTAAQTRLARFRLTDDALQAAQAQVEQTFALKSAQEQEKGEAQHATQQRNAAITALAAWLADFKVVARLALTDSPQLLEALNLGPQP
jgi:hypothetical protein